MFPWCEMVFGGSYTERIRVPSLNIDCMLSFYLSLYVSHGWYTAHYGGFH
jgi:hypothetical protein